MQKLNLLILVFIGTLFSCSSGFLKYEKSNELKDIGEFENQVKIETPEETDLDVKTSSATNEKSNIESSESKSEKNKQTCDDKNTKSCKVIDESKANVPEISKIEELTKKKSSKNQKFNKQNKKNEPASNISKHEPDLEGQDGFIGRRPKVDPFWVGEKVVHEVSYFSTKAGELEMSVKPFAQVNGKRSYHFKIAIKTASIFDMFYSVDDYVTTLVDFESLVPSVFTLHVKESKQLREARFFLDDKTKKARYWEKKVTKENGPEEKKLEWEVADYSQNVFSAIFYMRVFPWVVGKENAFRVTDAEENLVFRGKAIRKEKISTSAGKFDAIVIKPEIELRGKFKPVGDIFVWLSDDDRKYILRIESKIKIGTLVSEVVKIDPGIKP